MIDFMKKAVIPKLKSVFIAILGCLSVASYGQKTDIKTEISQLQKQQKLAGAVWAIVENDSIKTYASGYKNLKTKEQMQESDWVNVGSLAKMVLGLGVLRLATEQKLNIDEPIKKYLPDLPLDNPWVETHPVTIRHLMDHTSGLSDMKLWHFFSNTSTPKTPLAEIYQRNPSVLKVSTQPGSMFSYSNTGYALLGMIIEAVAKQPYELYIDNQILRPIGMTQSTFQFVSQARNPKLAMGHLDNGEPCFAMPIYVRPAGQFTTTAYDMGLLLKFLMNDAQLNQKEYIRKDYIQNIGIQTHTIAAKQGIKNGYAFAGTLRDRHGVEGIYHSGNIVGFFAIYYYFPKEKKAFFIAHNMDSESADYESFNKKIIDYLFPKKANLEQPKNQTTSLNLNDWAGYYVPVITKIKPFELFDILSSYTKIENGAEGLIFKPLAKKGIVLKAAGANLFRTEGRQSPSHAFYEDKAKQKFMTTGILTLKKINGWKLLILYTSFGLGLLACFIVLFKGLYLLVFQSTKFTKTPTFYLFISLVLLIIASIWIAINGFMQIGNKNAASIILLLGTILLPFGVVISLIKTIRDTKSLNFWVSLIAAQFVILLAVYDLIPFVLWK